MDLLQNNEDNPRQLSPKQKSNGSTKLATQELELHTLTFNLSPAIDWNATTRDFDKSSNEDGCSQMESLFFSNVQSLMTKTLDMGIYSRG